MDGTWYDISFDAPAALFMSSITLPTNGKDFTAHVEIDFSANGTGLIGIVAVARKRLGL